MGDEYDWLPDLVTLAEYNGRWEDYVGALYEVFREDFLQNKPTLNSKPIELLRGCCFNNKEYGFWYLTHDHPQGRKKEDTWEPNLRRCERLNWIIPVIKAYEYGSGGIRCWRPVRDGKERFVIGLDDFRYVVVLAELNGTWLLITHYFVEEHHRREKLREEYERYK